MREEADLLDHVADTAPELHRIDLVHIASLHEHRALVGIMQTVDELDEGGLAAARGAKHADELALFDREVHTVERGMGHALEALRDVFEFNGGGHDRLLPLLS